MLIALAILFKPEGGRILGFDLDGDVPPAPRNPYPFLRVIFAKKGTHF